MSLYNQIQLSQSSATVTTSMVVENRVHQRDAGDNAAWRGGKQRFAGQDLWAARNGHHVQRHEPEAWPEPSRTPES